VNGKNLLKQNRSKKTLSAANKQWGGHGGIRVATKRGMLGPREKTTSPGAAIKRTDRGVVREKKARTFKDQKSFESKKGQKRAQQFHATGKRVGQVNVGINGTRRGWASSNTLGEGTTRCQ